MEFCLLKLTLSCLGASLRVRSAVVEGILIAVTPVVNPVFDLVLVEEEERWCLRWEGVG
jgi:hypothetical protein